MCMKIKKLLRYDTILKMIISNLKIACKCLGLMQSRYIHPLIRFVGRRHPNDKSAGANETAGAKHEDLWQETQLRPDFDVKAAAESDPVLRRLLRRPLPTEREIEVINSGGELLDGWSKVKPIELKKL
eukprot:TRINITY_DN1028_c0_g1_i9.p3 TRINITY_DN1028_c0_g1~~TRINITY_DN1028_c0_g1_i9.p3  ORF type:complete len:144 (-),score=27.60 TRINITY_DN1028_c0_g1_i9:1884-2267(-)